VAGTLAKMIILLLFIQTIIAGADERFSIMGESIQTQVENMANADNLFDFLANGVGIAGNIIGVPFKLAEIFPGDIAIFTVVPLVIFIGIGGYKLIRRGT